MEKKKINLIRFVEGRGEKKAFSSIIRAIHKK